MSSNPGYVNSGSILAASASAFTSLTVTLPGSRSNGNLLVGFGVIGSLNALSLDGASTNWNLINTWSSSVYTFALAYAFVTGAEASLKFDMSANSSGNAWGQVFQFSGGIQSPANPVGNVTFNSGLGTSPQTTSNAGFNSTGVNSAVLGIIGMYNQTKTGVIPDNTGFTTQESVVSPIAIWAGNQNLGATGSASTAISASQTGWASNMEWSTWEIEIKAIPPAASRGYIIG